MLPLFRKIRLKLANENKFLKYSRYAIGEIALVMIGILLALQVNNWNESKKEKRIERMYLKNILSDLKDQNTSFDIQIESELSYHDAAIQIIKNYQENNMLVMDSTFFKNATLMTSRKTFVINDPTYTDLISSGNINMLKNVAYKNKLIKYYQELERIEKVIQNNNSLLVDQHYVSVFMKNGYYYQNSTTEEEKIIAELTDQTAFQTYKTALSEISQKLMLIDEHKLAFMNVIYFRQSLAIHQISIIKNIQSVTESLILEIEQLNND